MAFKYPKVKASKRDTLNHWITVLVSMILGFSLTILVNYLRL